MYANVKQKLIAFDHNNWKLVKYHNLEKKYEVYRLVYDRHKIGFSKDE